MLKITSFFGLLLFFLSEAHALLDPAKIAKIKTELGMIEHAGGDRLGYAEAMLEYLNGGKSTENSPWRERPQVSPFDLFSGALAIRESLQIDSIRPSASNKATGSADSPQAVDVATLKGPQVQSHPFSQMLKGRKSEAFPLAANVPPDWFYAHFSSLTRALDFGDYLNQTGGAFYNRFSNAPVDSALKKRIMAQLAIVENKEARIFYDSVIDEMAMVSSDFFFGMGTDVSLLFKLKQKMLFETTIKMYRSKYLKEVPGAKEESIQIENATVHFISSPDHRLRSLLYLEGDFAIISNSPAALTRLIRIAAKKETSLASLDEFKYMRSVYTASRDAEDGFMYFSDAFIRRLVSPQLRIAEARRMETAYRLAQVEKRILFHQHVYGKTAANAEELVRNTALDENTAKELRQLTAGLKIDGFRAEHPEFGTLGFLKPNLETPVKLATRAESAGYKAFVGQYSNLWREYFDPIGIRFKKKSNGIKIEIAILPLIENSIYNQITQLMGGTPPTHTITSMPGETLSLAAKVNLEPMKALRVARDEAQFLEGLTGSIQIHGLDNYPTIDFEPNMLFRELTRGRMRADAMIGVLAWSLFHPLRMSLEMKDTAAAEGLIATLSGMSHYESRRRTYDTYDYVYNGKKITVFVLDFFRTLTFRFHAWVDGKTIQVTSTREYAEKFIDAKKETQAQKGNLVALYRPAQIKNEKPAIVQSNAEVVQKGCLAHLGTVKLASLVFPNEDVAEAIAKRYGFKLVCPAGGNYSIKKGHPIHSMFGTRALTHTDMKAVEELFADFFATEEFKLNFEFTPHGIMTSIETK
jgi:hypothetical protein